MSPLVPVHGQERSLTIDLPRRQLRSRRPRKRGNAPRVPTESASQPRQRSRGSDRIGLASEAALQGFAQLLFTIFLRVIRFGFLVDFFENAFPEAALDLG
jgi:hypothetical protein